MTMSVLPAQLNASDRPKLVLEIYFNETTGGEKRLRVYVGPDMPGDRASRGRKAPPGKDRSGNNVIRAAIMALIVAKAMKNQHDIEDQVFFQTNIGKNWLCTLHNGLHRTKKFNEFFDREDRPREEPPDGLKYLEKILKTKGGHGNSNTRLSALTSSFGAVSLGP